MNSSIIYFDDSVDPVVSRLTTLCFLPFQILSGANMRSWWFLFFLGQLVSSVEFRLTIVSWNVNGASKFAYLPSEREFLREHDVVFLQETYSRENSLLDLAGFRSHHSLARQSTGPKPFWGLLTFFRTALFDQGYIKREYSPCDWLLISRWMRGPAQPGIVFLNIYLSVGTTYPEMDESH
jgi:hypothetical protein